jgi:hypothetical protein
MKKDKEEPLDFLARQAQELNMGYDMGKIKTPEEFYIEHREKHLIKSIGTSDFCQSMMQAYHEYAMKAVIEELEEEKFPKQLMGSVMAQRWNAAIVRAIEILKSRI